MNFTSRLVVTDPLCALEVVQYSTVQMLHKKRFLARTSAHQDQTRLIDRIQYF